MNIARVDDRIKYKAAIEALKASMTPDTEDLEMIRQLLELVRDKFQHVVLTLDNSMLDYVTVHTYDFSSLQFTATDIRRSSNKVLLNHTLATKDLTIPSLALKLLNGLRYYLEISKYKNYFIKIEPDDTTRKTLEELLA